MGNENVKLCVTKLRPCKGPTVKSEDLSSVQTGWHLTSRCVHDTTTNMPQAHYINIIIRKFIGTKSTILLIREMQIKTPDR